MNRIPDKKNIIRILISIGIPLLYLFAVSKMTGLCFETNDDRVITEILSGTLTGEPDGHTVQSNYLLSYPLSVLYRVSVRVPWYGGLLVLCHFLAYAAVLYIHSCCLIYLLKDRVSLCSPAGLEHLTSSCLSSPENVSGL